MHLKFNLIEAHSFVFEYGANPFLISVRCFIMHLYLLSYSAVFIEVTKPAHLL